MSLTCFIDKLDSKNAEANNLKAELEALKNSGPVSSQASVSKPTYATKVASAPKAAVATAPKSKKASEKEQLSKSRKVKATTCFMIEIPSGMTVARQEFGKR
ncbi:unnamed protein product [Macrosiphum euphorbiae]|uniref:Uncharacterized protein n=1 Tax=Macrosiphum euphorbiae TaxID=13131 RepID=A0AAV0WQM5_9HEMI|nr:unnamed protein product [Macrosiphum euphorbiae]